MSKLINLLTAPVLFNGKTLYPSQKSKLDALTGDDFTVSNLQNIDYYNNGYQADLITTDGFVRASAQKWNSAIPVNLKNVQTNGVAGNLLDCIQQPANSITYTIDGNIKNVYITVMDAADDAQVLTGLQAGLGIALAADDYTLSTPTMNTPSYRKVVFKSPYLVGNVYVVSTRFESAIFVTLPDASIGRVTYAKTQQDPAVDKITVASALAWNAYYASWNSTVDLETMTNRLAGNMYNQLVFFNDVYTMYSGGVGNTYFNCKNGLIDGSNTWGYNKLTYTIDFFEDSDWFEFIEVADLDALAAVTTEGFYKVTDQNIYKYWLMTNPNSGAISTMLNEHSKKIYFMSEDYSFGISGSGDDGVPNPTYKYRGSLTLANAIMQNASIYVRWIGE